MESRDPETTRSYCLFPSGARLMAVDVESVEAIMQAARLVRLPLCPHPVLGLCTYRGGLLPIIGTADGPVAQDKESGIRNSAVLILRTGGGPLGLRVDRSKIAVVEGCGAEGDGRIQETSPPPGILVAAGSIVWDGMSYPLLDPDRTWRAVRDRIERGYDAGRGIGMSGSGASAVTVATGNDHGMLAGGGAT